MTNDPEAGMREEARASLDRMQQFDVASLPRENELGSTFAFHEAVEPATRLIDLYSRLVSSVLDDLPQQQLQQIRDQANQDFNRLDEILKFDPTQQNATQARQQLIQHLSGAYQATFNLLHPFISYALHKITDFERLEGEARSTLQNIRDQASQTTEDLKSDKEEAEGILTDIRKVAAERGVTQQAIYFQSSAENHEKEASRWQKYTICVAIGLGVYSLASLFIHKVPGLDPTSTYQAVQIGVSKVLVFTVISYMLYLCARVFLSHKHNAIVDRHRQNALMTYKALVDAAGDTPNREVILVQAGACIFSPQATGYSHESVPPPPGAHSVVEFLSKPLKSGGE